MALQVGYAPCHRTRVRREASWRGFLRPVVVSCEKPWFSMLSSRTRQRRHVPLNTLSTVKGLRLSRPNLVVKTISTCTNHHRYPPRPSHGRALQGDSNLVDRSWRLSDMYLEMAREEDTEGWKADAEGILLFVSPTLSSVLSMRTQPP